MAKTNAPVEGKVWSATIGGGTGFVASELLLWVLGVTVFGVPYDAASAALAVAAVPDPVSNSITALVALGGVFLGGYLAKHTPRIVTTDASVDSDVKDETEEDSGQPVVHESLPEDGWDSLEDTSVGRA